MKRFRFSQLIRRRRWAIVSAETHEQATEKFIEGKVDQRGEDPEVAEGDFFVEEIE